MSILRYHPDFPSLRFISLALIVPSSTDLLPPFSLLHDETENYIYQSLVWLAESPTIGARHILINDQTLERRSDEELRQLQSEVEAKGVVVEWGYWPSLSSACERVEAILTEERRAAEAKEREQAASAREVVVARR